MQCPSQTLRGEVHVSRPTQRSGGNEEHLLLFDPWHELLWNAVPPLYQFVLLIQYEMLADHKGRTGIVPRIQELVGSGRERPRPRTCLIEGWTRTERREVRYLRMRASSENDDEHDADDDARGALMTRRLNATSLYEVARVESILSYDARGLLTT